MEAERDSGKVERQKTVEEVTGWVIVGCDEGVGDVDTVMPCLMPVCEGTAGRGVEDLLVDVVLEDLCARSVFSSQMTVCISSPRCSR